MDPLIFFVFIDRTFDLRNKFFILNSFNISEYKLKSDSSTHSNILISRILQWKRSHKTRLQNARQQNGGPT